MTHKKEDCWKLHSEKREEFYKKKCQNKKKNKDKKPANLAAEDSTASLKAGPNFFALPDVELPKVVEIRLSFSHYNAAAAAYGNHDHPEVWIYDTGSGTTFA